LSNVAAIVEDYRTADIDEPTRSLLAFAERLTRLDPVPLVEDLDLLRDQGFSDADIHDAVQVIGYFNYITRVADALGAPLDPWLVEFEQELVNPDG
jgi:alkylhydroperoxidase family enzyme